MKEVIGEGGSFWALRALNVFLFSPLSRRSSGGGTALASNVEQDEGQYT